MTDPESETESATDTGATDCDARRRHAAGENPAKRDQILDGATDGFMDKGFDGASMNDICRATGVSKGTLYVYFADKVDLFEAIIIRERGKIIGDMQAILDSESPIEDRLRMFGLRLAQKLCSNHVIRAQRIVIGAVEQMPELGRRFYEAGAQHTQGQLHKLFEQEVAAGRLVMPDTRLAAMQFVDLAIGPLWRVRIFTADMPPPNQKEIERVVDSAVRMFLAAYAPA